MVGYAKHGLLYSCLFALAANQSTVVDDAKQRMWANSDPYHLNEIFWIYSFSYSQRPVEL